MALCGDPTAKIVARFFEIIDRDRVVDDRLAWRVEDVLRREFGGARYYFRKTSPAAQIASGSTRRESDD